MLLANITAAVLAFAAPVDTLKSSRVTADRSAGALSSVPLQSVSEDDIRRRGAAGLEEILSTFTGVSVRDYGGLGGMKTVSIRNLGAAHTAIILDGFSIGNVQTGQTDLGGFNMDEISSIKVDMAGSDDIFRSARTASSAGTLRLETARPRFLNGNTEASAQLRAGSFWSFSPSFRVAHKFSGSWRACADGKFLGSKGDYPFTLVNGTSAERLTRQNGEILSGTGNVRVWGDLSGTTALLADGGFALSSRGLPGSVIFYNQDSFEHLYERNAHLRTRVDSRPSENWHFSGTLCWEQSWNRWTSSNPIYSTPADDRYLQNELSLGGIAMFSTDFGWSSLGVSFAQDFVFNSLDTTIPESVLPRRLTSASSLSARWAGEIFSVTAQLAAVFIHEMSALENRDSLAATFQTLAEDRAHLSPSLSANVLIAKGLRLRASIKEGYRVPTFNDLYYSRVGNSSLKPERALQTNLGLSWNGGSTPGQSVGKEKIAWTAEASADFYWNRVRDKIVAIPTMFIWKMQNAGTVRMLGTDLHTGGAVIPAEGWRIGLDAGYSWQYAVDISDPEAKNYKNQIPYTPRHCGSAVLSADLPWFGVSYTVNAVGKRWFMAQNIPANEIAAYAEQNISLHRDFKLSGKHPERHKLHLSAEVLNLGNVNYEIVKYYPMPGINWRITIKYTF